MKQCMMLGFIAAKRGRQQRHCFAISATISVELASCFVLFEKEESKLALTRTRPVTRVVNSISKYVNCGTCKLPISVQAM